MENFDYTKFYNSIRKDLFKGTLTQSQVDGINTILENTTDLSRPERAYILATVYHETAKQMQPLSEYGKGKSYSYGKWQQNSKGTEYCFKNGSKSVVYTKDECPHLFYGRGLVQLTWYDNYELATRKLQKVGILTPEQSLIKDPELANNPKIATWIMKLGMVEGWFTSRKLSDYIRTDKKDYVNARRIINGMDSANAIALYADYFEKGLLA